MKKEIKRELDTVEELEIQKEEIIERLRAKKKVDSEIRLQDAVSKMDTSEENIAEIVKACYSYIATHRKQ